MMNLNKWMSLYIRATFFKGLITIMLTREEMGKHNMHFNIIYSQIRMRNIATLYSENSLVTEITYKTYNNVYKCL